MSTLGIIGGSGIYDLDNIKIIKEHKEATPFGVCSSAIVEAEIDGNRFFFLPRHGKGHTVGPSEINYRANVFALKKLGVRTIISITAVGSLKEELPPKMFVLPDQFIDWTKGLRKRTFFDEGLVGHVSVANPVEKVLQSRIAKICEDKKIDHSVGGSYVCIEGPQFSSRAESAIYRSFGASVIGMTNVPEVYLAKEAGMAYATAAMVTDYDCWKEEHCTLEEIIKTMNSNTLAAQKLISGIVADLTTSPIEFTPENQYAVITKKESISDEHQAMLEVLLK